MLSKLFLIIIFSIFRVTRDIMENELVTADLKQRIVEAKQIGIRQADCRKYFCSELDLSKHVK